MAPAKITKNTGGLMIPFYRIERNSTHVVKRSAEGGEKKDTTGEIIKKKRGRPRKQETILRLQKEEEEKKKKERENEKKLIETREKSREKSYSKTSFMDLSDDIHTQIFNYLDRPSRLKLRVNKRLDRLYFSVAKNYWERIEFHIELNSSQLIMSYNASIRDEQLIQVERFCRRFALNSSVFEISIVMNAVPNEQHCRIIDALFHFDTNTLIMVQCQDLINFNLSHLRLSSYLALVQNVRDASICARSNNLTAHDLCIIRKAILEGGCMQSFEIWLENGMDKSFAKQCLGVTIEHVSAPFRGKIYRSENAHIELYQIWGSDLAHVECDLRTAVGTNSISLEKLGVNGILHDKFKIKLNHVYAAY